MIINPPDKRETDFWACWLFRNPLSVPGTNAQTEVMVKVITKNVGTMLRNCNPRERVGLLD
jgi:hypothetical protein